MNARRYTVDVRCRRQGAVLALVLAVLMVVSLASAATIQYVLRARRQAVTLQRQQQSQWLAQSGILRAKARLAADPNYRGETWQLDSDEFGSVGEAGTVRIEVKLAADTGSARSVECEARYPDNGLLSVTTQIQVSLSDHVGGVTP